MRRVAAIALGLVVGAATLPAAAAAFGIVAAARASARRVIDMAAITAAMVEADQWDA